MAIDRRGGSGSSIEQPAPARGAESGQTGGMLLPLVVLRCNRCGAQAVMDIPPTPVFRLPNGLLLTPDHEGKTQNPFPTTGSAEPEVPLENPMFVLFLPRPEIPCPQCSSTSLLIPSGGMPPLPPKPRLAH